MPFLVHALPKRLLSPPAPTPPVSLTTAYMEASGTQTHAALRSKPRAFLWYLTHFPDEVALLSTQGEPERGPFPEAGGKCAPFSADLPQNGEKGKKNLVLGIELSVWELVPQA